MKQFLMGLSISAAFIVGCVAATAANDVAVPRAHSADAPGMELWENQCVVVPAAGHSKKQQALFAEMGASGWQLVTIESLSYCFKRRVG